MDEIESQDAVVETEEAPEEQAPEVEEASADEESEHLEGTEEAPTEGEPPEEAAPEVEPEPSPPEKPVVQPFSFTADRKRVEVQGASVVEHPGPDGKPTRSIVIPLDAFQRHVQPYLADRGSFANKERDYQRQLAALSPDKNETVIRAQTILDEFEKVLGSEESLTGFLENFEHNRELLKLKVENAAVQAKLKARDDGEREVQSERDTETTVQRVQSDVPNVVQQAAAFVSQRTSMPVSPQALQAAYETIMENLPAFYRRATPQDAQLNQNITVGEIVRDDDKVISVVHRFAGLLNAGSEQKAKTTEAAKRNQAALGGTKKKPPPTIAAKGSAPPKESVTEIKSWEDFKAKMGGHV